MANSKANIYPIQLQGAQLNLNKYDAEIKQYSGFNKNNAPYVGGCLANVFTKDETQEGSTSENTYIDTNGDVYHVDTEGLWKNGEKVIDCEGKNFYSVEKVDIPENVVYIHDEYCYITAEENRNGSNIQYTFCLNFYDPVLEGWSKKDLLSRTYGTGISQYNYCCTCYKYNNTYVWISEIYIPNGDYLDYYYNIFVSYKDGEIKKYGEYSGNYRYTRNSQLYRTEIGIRCLFQNENTLYLNFETGIFSAVDTSPYGVNKSYRCTLDYTGSSIVINRTSIFIPVVYDFDSSLIPSGDKYYKYGKVVCVPYNNTNFDRKIHTFQTKLQIIDNEIKLFAYNPTYYGNLSAGSNYTGYLSTIKYYKNVGWTYIVYFNDNSHFYACGFCDFNTWGTTYNEEEQAWEMNLGLVLNKYVLINNGLISGLTLPDTGQILVTDWNTIDDKYLFFPEKESYFYKSDTPLVYYKTSEGFYKLKYSIPQLKHILSQIVVNCDTILNSYRLSDGKQLLFAPSWNNRMVNVNDRSVVFEEGYFASSINEYNLADNSSIILNPIKVNSRDGMGAVGSIPDFIKDVFVNTYLSNNENEIIYNGSLSLIKWGGKFINPNLKDLPFPSDANGNVQYSPSLFSEIKSVYGNEMFIKNGNTFYPLMKGNNNEPVMSFYLASSLDNLEEGFIVQGQFYGIINNDLYSIQYSNGVLADVSFVVDTTGLKFCGNTPYQAFFFSKTNRCLYSFTGANVMNQAQFLDKFEDVIGYKYNPATQTIFMITANEVIAYSSFGTYEIYFPNCTEIYLLENGACLTDDEGNYRYIKYYAEEGYTKHNINIETCFYGMNNQTVTINDCLYVRLFSEEHESGNVEMTASTLSNSGRMTEKTTFKIKSTDWDKMTHTVYLRYQPKEQRGLGVSFSINSPFKIAALSVGSQPDAILIDKVSKNAINAPQRTTNNNEW